MAHDSLGTHNQPQYSGTGAPSDAADLSEVANFAATVGNAKSGTTAQMNALAGADRWTGLLFSNTTDGKLYVWNGSGWVLPNYLPKFKVKSAAPQTMTGAAPVVTTLWAAPSIIDSAYFTWSAGLLTVGVTGIYDIASAIQLPSVSSVNVSGGVSRNSANFGVGVFVAADATQTVNGVQTFLKFVAKNVALTSGDVLRVLVAPSSAISAADSYTGEAGGHLGLSWVAAA